jgi:hypothetical protein
MTITHSGVGKMGKTTHGESKTRLYHTWRMMRYRCQNKNLPIYQKYGARGISVCDKWDKSYIAFRDWALSNGYRDDLTIDRIDGDGDYCPENCRWVDYYIQNTNLRISTRNKSGHIGISFENRRKKWKATISVNKKFIQIGEYRDINDAINARNQYIDKHNLPHTKS